MVTTRRSRLVSLTASWELVADQFTPGWDNAEALALMEQILVAAENDVNGVFAANDGSPTR